MIRIAPLDPTAPRRQDAIEIGCGAEVKEGAHFQVRRREIAKELAFVAIHPLFRRLHLDDDATLDD